jgi:RimJ/RimL family protein N-acetyltransferase
VEPAEGAELPDGLRAHWRAWLGATDDELAVLGAVHDGPPPVVVVGAEGRTRAGWDGAVHAVTGIVDAAGAAVVSVPPQHLAWARSYVAQAGHGGEGGADPAAGGALDALRAALPERLGLPGHIVFRGVCRWSDEPPTVEQLPDAGQWLPFEDPRVPEWLRPFGGDVLVALDDGDGRYLAGVGLKRHDRYGHEISVGTDERARGRGLARRLVAQASRTLHAQGVVATYLHDPANVASARVADAAGFPDRGWGVLGIFRVTS